MGVEFNVYFGSFLKVEQQTEKLSDNYYIHYECKECGEKYNSTAKFCSGCGNEIIEIKEPIFLNVFDLLEENDLRYNYTQLNNTYSDSDDFDLLGFNSPNEFYKRFDDTDELHLTEQTFPKKAGEKEFEDIIKSLKENDFEYEVCFGLVLYST